MKTMLSTLEKHYGSPVDTEFTVEIVDPHGAAQAPEVRITLLQCRPQSALSEEGEVDLPARAAPGRHRFCDPPHGPARKGGRHPLGGVRPSGGLLLARHSNADRNRLERAIGNLNSLLKDETFICVGPGRWGTSTPDLGVGIAYGDIYHTRALVELTGRGVSPDLEPSFGTHFFQDLMEAHIFPLNVNLDDRDCVIQPGLFRQNPQSAAGLLAADEDLLRCLRLLRVDDFRPGCSLTLVMDDDAGRAVAFVKKD